MPELSGFRMARTSFWAPSHHLVFDLNRSDLLCLIIGDGDALSALRRQAVELAVADCVLFTGWIDDPDRYTRYLATAEICVDPSPSTAYNDRCTTIKTMDYMAAGKPIVAFDLPEHRFTAQSSAIYARPNDERGQFAELMDSPERRQRMGPSDLTRLSSNLLGITQFLGSWKSMKILLKPSYQKKADEGCMERLQR